MSEITIDQRAQDQVIVIGHQLIAEQLDLVKRKRFVQNPLKGGKVCIFVKNLRTQISTIEGMIKSTSFVGAEWPWHRVLSYCIAKTVV